jgi:hypothetical protein
MRDSRDLDDGENTQNSNIVKSFHPISRYRSIKGTPYETRASHEQNIGSLMTPVKWEQSCGPGIWAEIIQPYEKKKSLQVDYCRDGCSEHYPSRRQDPRLLVGPW